MTGTFLQLKSLSSFSSGFFQSVDNLVKHKRNTFRKSAYFSCGFDRRGLTGTDCLPSLNRASDPFIHSWTNLNVIMNKCCSHPDARKRLKMRILLFGSTVLQKGCVLDQLAESLML